MSSSSTNASERSALLSPKPTDSDAISYRSFPGPNDVDAPDEEGPLLEEASRPSLASRHGITVLRGTSIVAALGVLVFLQGTKFHIFFLYMKFLLIYSILSLRENLS